jgi:hypothetical protein
MTADDAAEPPEPSDDEATARAWVMLLISDMSWLVGNVEGGGSTVPDRITDDLRDALSWLAGTP